jgi:hypothetical protein
MKTKSWAFALLVGMTLLPATICAQDQDPALDPVGVITGKVQYVGDPFTPEKFEVSGDSTCVELTKDNLPVREDVIENPDGTLKNVVVWVESGWPDGYKPKSAPKGTAVLTQEKCHFYPHVLAVQKGQPVQLNNEDPTLSNVNFQPRNNPRFNRTVLGKDDSLVELTFTNPEMGIKVRDAIHPWMNAWIVVLDNPAYDMTGDDGLFEIKGLPQGEYILKAWHEKFGTATVSVLVRKDKPADVLFNFTQTGAKAGNQLHPNEGTPQ